MIKPKTNSNINMIKGINLISLFSLALLFAQTKPQLVYSQLQNKNNYDINEYQDNLRVNLGQNFENTKQYSIWGWFKPASSNPAIQNLVTIKNITGSPSFIKKEFEGPFPNCPFTPLQLQNSPNLMQTQEYIENPNCDFENLGEGKKEDLIYINYDLEPAKDGTQKYGLIFIIQKGVLNNQSEMIIEGFFDLQRTDAWSFFGISLDYENGTASIYLKVFDSANSAPMFKSFAIEYNNFQL